MDGSEVTGAGPPTIASVGVVVPAYNHAAFLGDALDSLMAQTRRPDRIVVVDDDSSDDPASVTRRYPDVELIRQPNGGPSAARNRGLAALATDYVMFLDADDRLLPQAIARSLDCHRDNPGCGFVYGAHRRVGPALESLGPPIYNACGASAYRDLLRGNMVASCPSVMFDRARLVECGGFDPEVRGCEDYDAYFRLARRYPAASHPGLVAEYRIHDRNTSPDPVDMLRWANLVLDRYRPDPADAAATADYRQGRRGWALTYANAVWRRRAGWSERWAMTARAPAASMLSAGAAALRAILPRRAYTAIRDVLRPGRVAVGSVAMGDLARTSPIGGYWGYDRGTPIDRWYIESFLAEHAADIHGRVLEVACDDYSRRFGSGITRQDILHRAKDHPGATIAGDLVAPDTLPSEAFDCLVITQTLQHIYDVAAGVEQFRRALKPGGVLLLTVPGVTSIDPMEWDGSWYWSFTVNSVRRMLGDVFGADNVEVIARGNVYATTCYMHGLALEEVDRDWIEKDDVAYPLTICARARRAG